jgi:hypothetical protein
MAKAEQPNDATACRSCDAVLPGGARFCTDCGTPVGEGAVAARSNRRVVILAGVAIVIAIFGSYVAVGRHVTERSATVSPPHRSETPPTPASAVDLTTMTPREAADRLFNRVMAADERGDRAEVARFAPMALQAYTRVVPLDLDARYHLGLISLADGDLALARRHVADLLREAPDHLLGLILAVRLAESADDAGEAAQGAARFAAAYDAEIVKARPEYQAHRATIDQFRDGQGVSTVIDRPAGVSQLTESGAQLFALNCAVCHGVAAAGSAMGPPLVHRIYEPAHHGDAAFRAAVRQGVKSHHWSFGDMPPVPGVTDAQVDRIIAHVRELQRGAGIE